MLRKLAAPLCARLPNFLQKVPHASWTPSLGSKWWSIRWLRASKRRWRWQSFRSFWGSERELWIWAHDLPSKGAVYSLPDWSVQHHLHTLGAWSNTQSQSEQPSARDILQEWLFSHPSCAVGLSYRSYTGFCLVLIKSISELTTMIFRERHNQTI